MTKRHDVYKCSVCGNIVDMVQPGLGELFCCGKPMDLAQAKSEDTGHEKHKPVVEKSKTLLTVTIGSIPHPMEEAHYIEWIEVITSEENAYRKFLKPGMPAQAKFENLTDVVLVRAYCNIHGLWETKI